MYIRGCHGTRAHNSLILPLVAVSKLILFYYKSSLWSHFDYNIYQNNLVRITSSRIKTSVTVDSFQILTVLTLER